MKTLWRNCSIISAFFVAVFAVMLTVNHIQYKKADALNTPALAALREQSDADPENQLLQQQIRDLDMLARKVYFTGKEQVRIGVYILLATSLILLVSLRCLHASYRNLPEKDFDRLDEWVVKTLSRKYIMYGGVGLIAVSLAVSSVSQRSMDSGNENITVSADAPVAALDEDAEPAHVAGVIPAETGNASMAKDTMVQTAGETDRGLPAGTPDTITAAFAAGTVISKVTHNGFRGNNGSAVSAAKDIPTDFDLAAGKNVLWKTPVVRQGYSSPVINGGKVFITAADNDARELFCYDLTGGALLWILKADNIPGSPSQMPQTADDTGLAASTAAANANVVCAIFATGDLIAADHSGKRLWAKNLGVPDNHYGYASSLLIYNGILFVQYDQNNGGKVYAFDAATGAEKWSKARTADKVAWASPIIANTGSRTELVLMGTPNITSYNPANGEEYWQMKCMSGEVGSSPAHAGGIIFGASEYATLVAVDAKTGTTLWENNDYLPETASAAATSSCVFIATTYGTLVCRDAKTGAENKVHELDNTFYSSPMIVEGKLYIFDTSGNLYIFTADKDCHLINTVKTGEKTFATPAFTDGKMVVRSDKNIYCVAKL